MFRIRKYVLANVHSQPPPSRLRWRRVGSRNTASTVVLGQSPTVAVTASVGADQVDSAVICA